MMQDTVCQLTTGCDPLRHHPGAGHAQLALGRMAEMEL